MGQVFLSFRVGRTFGPAQYKNILSPNWFRTGFCFISVRFLSVLARLLFKSGRLSCNSCWRATGLSSWIARKNCNRKRHSYLATPSILRAVLRFMHFPGPKPLLVPPSRLLHELCMPAMTSQQGPWRCQVVYGRHFYRIH